MQDSASRASSRDISPKSEPKDTSARALESQRAASSAAVAYTANSSSSAVTTTAAAGLFRPNFCYDGPIAGNSPMCCSAQEVRPIVNWPQGMRGYVLNLTLEGEGLVRDGERCFVCRPGDLILIPPNVPHFYHINDGCETWVHQWIYFYPRSYWLSALNFPLALHQLPSAPVGAAAASPEASASTSAEQGLPYNPMGVVQLEQEYTHASTEPSADDAAGISTADELPQDAEVTSYAGKIGYFKVPDHMWDEITSLFQAIVDRSFSPHAYSQLLATNYLEQILFRRVEQGLGEHPQVVDSRVAISCLFIRENLSNNQMTIADIAERVQLSPSRISHLFERYMGMSLIKWRDQERFKLAKSLLLTTDLKIEHIAAQVGINDSGYFFKFFKRNCGLTPSQFRREFMGKLNLDGIWNNHAIASVAASTDAPAPDSTDTDTSTNTD